MATQEIKRHNPGTVTILRAEGDDSPRHVIRGRAIVFNQSTELYNDGELCIREKIDPAAITEDLLKRSDIKMTIDHDPSRLLARSKMGKGTLTYKLSKDGVDFEFEAPNTTDGNDAYELVSRGIIDGCSFWAGAGYEDVERTRYQEGDLRVVERTIKRFAYLRDFTLTASPQYEQTECEALARSAKEEMEQETVSREKAAADMERSWSAVEAEINR